MFSADSALAILHTCAPGELEEALRNRPEMIIRLRNVLDAFPPGPGIGTASQSSTTPQAAAATQASASTTTPQPFAQPCMVPGFGGAPIFLMAPGPPPRPASEAPPTQQATAGTRPTICIRGRDVPHSTPQPEPRPSTTLAKIGGTGRTGGSPGGTKITDALHPHRHHTRLPHRQDSAARHQSSMSRAAMLGRKDGQSAPSSRRTCTTRHMAAHGTGASAARCCAPWHAPKPPACTAKMPAIKHCRGKMIGAARIAVAGAS